MISPSKETEKSSFVGLSVECDGRKVLVNGHTRGRRKDSPLNGIFQSGGATSVPLHCQYANPKATASKMVMLGCSLS